MILRELLRCCAPDTYIYIDKRYHGLAKKCPLDKLGDLPVVQFFADGNAIEIYCGNFQDRNTKMRVSGNDLRGPSMATFSCCVTQGGLFLE